ncbi:putative uncharacterized protein DDB_G0282499 [Centruroides vittatus]|uniref:putative uncharacterized protein DDB_G0282499 n=1 Tax=Centruroides vittatus TaxID=120091 RepID=UPI0035106215
MEKVILTLLTGILSILSSSSFETGDDDFGFKNKRFTEYNQIFNENLIKIDGGSDKLWSNSSIYQFAKVDPSKNNFIEKSYGEILVKFAKNNSNSPSKKSNKMEKSKWNRGRNYLKNKLNFNSIQRLINNINRYKSSIIDDDDNELKNVLVSVASKKSAGNGRRKMEVKANDKLEAFSSTKNDYDFKFYTITAIKRPISTIEYAFLNGNSVINTSDGSKIAYPEEKLERSSVPKIQYLKKDVKNAKISDEVSSLRSKIMKNFLNFNGINHLLYFKQLLQRFKRKRSESNRKEPKKIKNINFKKLKIGTNTNGGDDFGSLYEYNSEKLRKYRKNSNKTIKFLRKIGKRSIFYFPRKHLHKNELNKTRNNVIKYKKTPNLPLIIASKMSGERKIMQINNKFSENLIFKQSNVSNLHQNRHKRSLIKSILSDVSDRSRKRLRPLTNLRETLFDSKKHIRLPEISMRVKEKNKLSHKLSDENTKYMSVFRLCILNLNCTKGKGERKSIDFDQKELKVIPKFHIKYKDHSNKIKSVISKKIKTEENTDKSENLYVPVVSDARVDADYPLKMIPSESKFPKSFQYGGMGADYHSKMIPSESRFLKSFQYGGMGADYLSKMVPSESEFPKSFHDGMNARLSF